MEDETPSAPSARQMSLIPYASDPREIVLRRGNAVVVFDANSRQLSVRDASDQPVQLTDCPYCHRPLESRDAGGGEGEHGRSFGPERPFVDPEYFGMLAASQRPSPSGLGPTTPSRRIPIAIRSGRLREVSGSTGPSVDAVDAEFVGSEPAALPGQGISSSAFSPGYFQQFFKEERELGRGGNGVVLLVEHQIDGVSLGHFACKRIPVGDSRRYFEKVIVEVRLLQRIPHKNLVAYHWTWLEDHQPSRFGPSIPCLWILQDYCNGGDLHSYVVGPQAEPTATERLKARLRRRSRGDAVPSADLRGPSKLAFDEIFSFFRDITSGLHHLHSKGYIHRDLKPSNCLLQRDGGRTKVLISDFGEVQAAGARRMSSGATGTISYCAPEVLQRDPGGSFGNFTTKSDIFSLGMVVYFMCFGRLPYANADDINEQNEDLDELRAEIITWAGFQDEARIRPDLPEKLYAYLRKLLSVDPHERPSTDEILASIKGGPGSADVELAGDANSARVSSVDSPTPKSASRARKQSYISSRSGLSSPARQNSTENVRSRSPLEPERSPSRPTSPRTSSLTTTKPRSIDLSSSSAQQTPKQSPRLMLPPPPPAERSFLTRVAQLVATRQPSTAFRIAIFLAKILSISVPCTPYQTNQWLLYPLLFIAAVDLGVLALSTQQSLLLLGVHIAMVLLAAQRSRLCEIGNRLDWDGI